MKKSLTNPGIKFILIVLLAGGASCQSKSCDTQSVLRSDSGVSAFFDSVYVRCATYKLIGGENDERLMEQGLNLLQKMGDQAFSTEFANQSVQKQSAMRLFMPPSLLGGKYPRTAKCLKKAPERDWPAEAAARADWTSLGKAGDPPSCDEW